MASKRILITGASSYLGETLVDTLKNLYELILLEHNKEILLKKDQNIKTIHGGLENISEWEKSLLGIDVIVHLAGRTHSKDASFYNKINTRGTINLVEASKRQNIGHFVYVSTRAVGKSCGAYGYSKELAEEYLKKSGIRYTILRVGEVYDEKFGDKGGLSSLANIIKKSYFVPFLFSNKVTLSPIHKKDVECGIIATLNNSATYYKTYILTGPENLSTKEIVVRMIKYFNIKRFLVPIPIFLIKLVYLIANNFFGFGIPDQLDRLLCKKELLNRESIIDLKINPRPFLLDS
jgi:nucleoside-diphosphate-sugar epimerase